MGSLFVKMSVIIRLCVSQFFHLPPTDKVKQERKGLQFSKRKCSTWFPVFLGSDKYHSLGLVTQVQEQDGRVRVFCLFNFLFFLQAIS